jgi:hypothetical protein
MSAPLNEQMLGGTAAELKPGYAGIVAIVNARGGQVVSTSVTSGTASLCQ